MLALLLGGLIGWEREQHERPAGLRTHILVCVGAALITQVSSQFGVNGDRIAAQIVTGVGFLGAGTILRNGVSGAVSGLTTAATLWAIAGVGIAVGYGGRYALLATIGTLLILFTLTLLNQFEDVLIRRRRRHELTVIFNEACNPLTALSHLLDMLRDKSVRMRDLKLEAMANTEVAQIQLMLSRGMQRDEIDTMLAANPDILHYEWTGLDARN
jgi:putative Mg2+ transporter-C (MgtC) family protein